MIEALSNTQYINGVNIVSDCNNTKTLKIIETYSRRYFATALISLQIAEFCSFLITTHEHFAVKVRE